MIIFYYIVFQPKYPLTDFSNTTLCDVPDVAPDFSGSAVAVARGNCTFSEKAELVQLYHGEVALIVSKIEMVSRIITKAHFMVIPQKIIL